MDKVFEKLIEKGSEVFGTFWTFFILGSGAFVLRILRLEKSIIQNETLTKDMHNKLESQQAEISEVKIEVVKIGTTLTDLKSDFGRIESLIITKGLNK